MQPCYAGWPSRESRMLCGAERWIQPGSGRNGGKRNYSSLAGFRHGSQGGVWPGAGLISSNQLEEGEASLCDANRELSLRPAAKVPVPRLADSTHLGDPPGKGWAHARPSWIGLVRKKCIRPRERCLPPCQLSSHDLFFTNKQAV